MGPDDNQDSAKVNFSGEDIKVNVQLTFEESLYGCEKEVTFHRNVLCGSCKGSKEQPGSSSSNCYSCKGSGIKKDPLFQTESKCNTCQGHGKLIKNPCKTCSGQGLVPTKAIEKVEIPKFTENNSQIKREHEGHHSYYSAEEFNSGHLLLDIKVDKDPMIKREGLNILSKHFITMSEAINGCSVEVKTVKGSNYIKVSPGTNSGREFILERKGVQDDEG
mmetsp:Transcript_8275/g.7680  ORF Transcript_8275/g.7680 Transcript_8275/m.7680 type:complete len:219 (-) Transcript_8275:36-692(-)